MQYLCDLCDRVIYLCDLKLLLYKDNSIIFTKSQIFWIKIGLYKSEIIEKYYKGKCDR